MGLIKYPRCHRKKILINEVLEKEGSFMRSLKPRYKLSTLAVVLTLFAVLPLIQADSARAESNLMRLIVPYGPGGGYDLYTRIVARHLGKYLPGNPKVIVQNMPGAGGLVGLSYLYNIAKPDGNTLMPT